MGVWKGFFSRAFAVGEEAIASRDLMPSEVVDQEPFLYLGLTALTALDFVKRSPPTGPMRMALGETDVTLDNCPPEAREILVAFMRLRDMYHAARLSPEEQRSLRRAVLLSGHDRGGVPAMRRECTDLIAGLHSLAVVCSQQPRFHQHFMASSNFLLLVRQRDARRHLLVPRRRCSLARWF